ncbi:hypothetical protein GF318_03990 [Candidatus Micrarchaeota archaeon]|nr:hypothetical protein [Candidatus Micrarchaeota archaeon]
MAEEEKSPLRIRSLALSLTAEFLLVIGVIMALLGIAQFTTDFLGVEGSGEMLAGIFLIVLAFVILFRSKAMISGKKGRKKEKEPSEDYR